MFLSAASRFSTCRQFCNFPCHFVTYRIVPYHILFDNVFMNHFRTTLSPRFVNFSTFSLYYIFFPLALVSLVPTSRLRLAVSFSLSAFPAFRMAFYRFETSRRVRVLSACLLLLCGIFLPFWNSLYHSPLPEWCVAVVLPFLAWPPLTDLFVFEYFPSFPHLQSAHFLMLFILPLYNFPWFLRAFPTVLDFLLIVLLLLNEDSSQICIY